MRGRHAEPAPIQTALSYNLRRSARVRRLRITVRPGGVEVVAPLRMRAADIATFVEHHRAWIDAKLHALQRVLAAHPGSAPPSPHAAPISSMCRCIATTG